MTQQLQVTVEINYNEGRPELWFFLQEPGGKKTGHYYSVKGMVNARPKYRQEILAACNQLYGSLPPEIHDRLTRAIARGESNQ